MATNPIRLVIDQTQGGLGNLGPELRQTGVVGLVGTATAATYNTSNGNGSVTRVDLANQSFVQFSGLTPSAHYLTTLQNTGSVGVTARTGNQAGAFSLTVASGLTDTGVVQASASGQITITTDGATGTASFILSSIKLVPGNHATASSDAKRPLFARYPATGRRNLLESTQEFDNSYWTKFGGASALAPVVTANNASAPDGTLTADRIVFNTTTGTTASDRSEVVKSGLARVSGTSYAGSIWLRGAVGGEQLAYRSSFGAAYQLITLTTEWQRFTTAANATATDSSDEFGFGIRQGQPFGTINSSATVFAWQAQREIGGVATADQRVVTSADITEVGVRDVYAGLFDGSDDCLQVSGFDLSNTDEVTVIAGVRKLSDAAGGVIVEHSADVNSNNGSFGIFAPTSLAANSVNSAYRGTSFVANATANSFTSPISGIIASVFDIAGPLNRQIINGMSINTVTTSAGTGNFANNTLNIGGRNNAASLPFNGYIHYLFICGAIVPDDILTRIYRGLGPRIGLTV